jgi:hypothetical protein
MLWSFRNTTEWPPNGDTLGVSEGICLAGVCFGF